MDLRRRVFCTVIHEHCCSEGCSRSRRQTCTLEEQCSPQRHVTASLLGTVDKKAWLEAALETYGGLSASTDVSEDGDVTKLTVKQDSAKGMYAFLCVVSRSFIGHLWLVGATQGTFPFRP